MLTFNPAQDLNLTPGPIEQEVVYVIIGHDRRDEGQRIAASVQAREAQGVLKDSFRPMPTTALPDPLPPPTEDVRGIKGEGSEKNDVRWHTSNAARTQESG